MLSEALYREVLSSPTLIFGLYLRLQAVSSPRYMGESPAGFGKLQTDKCVESYSAGTEKGTSLILP